MDSYSYAWYMNTPASPPLPDEHSGGYLPQMPPYNGTSQSQNTSVPQPIDFGSSVTGYSGDASQSRHSSVPPIEYGSSSRAGRTTGSGSSASQQTIRQQYPDEVKSKALSEMQQEVARGGTLKSYADRSTIPYVTLKNWHRSITTRGHQTYSDEVKSKVLSEIQEEMASGGTLKSYADRSTIPYSTLREWRGSITTRVRRTYSDEEKASILSGLRQELKNKTSTLKSYAEKNGIPVRTLSYWLKDID